MIVFISNGNQGCAVVDYGAQRKCKHEYELTRSDDNYRYLKCGKCGDEQKLLRHPFCANAASNHSSSSSSAQETSAASAESSEASVLTGLRKQYGTRRIYAMSYGSFKERRSLNDHHSPNPRR